MVSNKKLRYILVVDDDESMLCIYQNFLKKINSCFKIVCADNGLAALGKMDRQKFDVIIVDLQMPKLDGGSLVTQMKADKKFKKIPIIIVSAKLTPDKMTFVMRKGIKNFIVKPVTKENLEAKLGTMFDIRI